MNKNPFVPTPSFAPQQPPLPPGPPPPQPTQPEYPYWSAQPTPVQYNPQWSAPQPAPRPPAEHSALYANYGYGTQWQRQQQQLQHLQQQQQQYHHPPPVAQQPISPPPQPAYNPYQPAAGYPQQYVQQAVAPPHPIPQQYLHPQPPQPQQQFFTHIPHPQPQQQQQQQQQRHTQHASPQHLPPAKRQRFDGPSSNRHPHNQQQPLPNQPPQNSGGFAPSGHGGNRGGVPGAPHGPAGGGGGGRGGAAGGRSGGGTGGGTRLSRGGSMSGRGAARGRGGGFSGGGSGSGGRTANQPGGSLRGHNSQRNFGGANQNRRGGSFSAGGSNNYQNNNNFRNRNQHPNRAARQDSNTLGPKDGAASTSFGSLGKEKRRTFTDFKIVGLEIPDLHWTWGTLPEAVPIKMEAGEGPESITTGKLKEKPLDERKPLEAVSEVDAPTDGQRLSAEATTVVDDKVVPGTNAEPSQLSIPGLPSLDTAQNTQPQSRLRFYFHTPVTPDDSRPIQHSSNYYGDIPSDTRKGKRKKLEDDDGDYEEGRAPPPPPQMGLALNDDRSSVAASAVSEDWLMAAITEGDKQAPELEPSELASHHEDENEEEEQMDVHDELLRHPDNDDVEFADGNVDGKVDGERSSLCMEDTSGPTHDGGADDTTASSSKTAISERPPAQNSAGQPEGSPSESASTEAANTTVVPVLASPETKPASSPSGEGDNDAGGAQVTKGTLSSVPAALTSIFLPLSNVVPSSPSSSSTAAVEQNVTVDHTNNSAQASASKSQQENREDQARINSLQGPRSLEAASAESTLLDFNQEETQSRDTTLFDASTQAIDGSIEATQLDDTIEEGHEFASQQGNGAESHHEHLPEPPVSPPISTTIPSTSSVSDESGPSGMKADTKAREPSPNRISISYAGGNRRLVIDSEVVQTLKLSRQLGRIEVLINVDKFGDDELKGILFETLSQSSKYTPLPALESSIADETLPPFSTLVMPSTVTLLIYLDTDKPLSEPKWAKTGDVQEWLRSIFGRMFWVGEAAGAGWEKKIQVVDHDPPPTIWTLLDGWATHSTAGIITERQRFLKTHMRDSIDNILEILLRLVRGERATPFSQSTPILSGPSVVGPLLSAVTPGSAHANQQTHVSLAVLAMFRIAVEYAQKALSEEKGKAEVEERVGEIIRCLPHHLIYKSLDGIFKEWRVDKKGR